MGSIRKSDLKRQLQSMGIKIEGNYVRKSDLKNILAGEDTTYVIKKGSKFWTGKIWSDEYPDAKIFKKEKDALTEKKTALKGVGDVYKDYGYEHETIIASKDSTESNYTFKRAYGISPSDYSKGKGGFEGEFFTVKGLTDTRFTTEESAVSAIKSQFPEWSEVKNHNSLGRIFKHPSKNKFLSTFEISVMMKDGREVEKNY